MGSFTQKRNSLLTSTAPKMAEAMVLRRASLEAKAARIEAELSIKARSQFLSNMNHELRTPLNAIIGFTTMLKDGALYGVDEEKRSSYADYILQSADLLLGHINTILEAADLDGGTVEIQQSAVDVKSLLDDAAKRAEIAARAANVKILLKNDDKEILAWVDETRLRQAVDHLLRIAMKASAKGARILARVSVNDQGHPEIAIRDSGAGLSHEDLQAALDAFSEDHRGLGRSFEGPGAELAIAKTFIEMQGGRFQVKSRVGKGTLVQAVLPSYNSAENADDCDVTPMKMTG